MKTLIISLSTGSGHVRAARALESYTKIYHKDHEVNHIDSAHYIGFFGRLTHKYFYAFCQKYTKRLWGYLYTLTSIPLISRAIHAGDIFQNLSARRLRVHIQTYSPDVIICTYFGAVQIVRHTTKRHNIKLYYVVTDYDAHPLYVAPNIDGYFVSSNTQKEKLKVLGVRKESIHISPIPIDPVFFEKKKREVLKKKYNMPHDKELALVLAKNQSQSFIQKVCGELLQKKNTYIVVIGNNKTVFSFKKEKVHYIPHTAHIDEYLRMADVVYTKPGGLIVTECIALGVPMKLFRSYGGQEQKNADYAISKGFATMYTESEM